MSARWYRAIVVMTALASMALALAACAGPKLGPPPSAAARLNAEGLRRLERGDDAGAEEMLRGALREAELIDDLPSQAEAWNNLGALAMAKGDAQRALGAHTRALGLYRAANVRGVGEIRTRGNLGAALLASGRIADAGAQFDEAARLATRIGEPSAARQSQVGLAVVALAQGDAARALTLVEAANFGGTRGSPGSASPGEHEDAALAGALAVQGGAHEALGQWDDARHSHERALEVDRRRGASRAVAEDLGSLARVAERTAHRADAVLFWARRARVEKEIGDREGALRDFERAASLAGEAKGVSDSEVTLELDGELRALRETLPVEPQPSRARGESP